MANINEIPNENDERLVRDAIRLRTATAAANAAYDALAEALTARGMRWAADTGEDYSAWVARLDDDATLRVAYQEWSRANNERHYLSMVIDGRARLAKAAAESTAPATTEAA